jgi:hypothetical protein
MRPEEESVQVEHLVANGYANAWRISGSGDVLVDISYRGRWLVPVGLVCAAVAFMGVAALAFLNRKKHCRTSEQRASEDSETDAPLSELGDTRPVATSAARDVIRAMLDHRFLMGMALLGFGATAAMLGLGAHVLSERVGSIAFVLFGIATLASCLKAKIGYPEPKR